MTASPYRVIDADHWTLEGTGLAEGDTFGADSLHKRVPGGASGHETDKISDQSPDNVHLIAKGTNNGCVFMPSDCGSENSLGAGLPLGGW